MQHRFQHTNNNARNFSNIIAMMKFRLFYHESQYMCCLGEKVLFSDVIVLNVFFKYFMVVRLKVDILNNIPEVTICFYCHMMRLKETHKIYTKKS